tara:strand:- start:128 stop:472 length:345 start_codon:yes stop_codon:yes gene_type:complete
MSERYVPYDSNESLWKWGNLISKFPDSMLSETLVFTPRNKNKDCKHNVPNDYQCKIKSQQQTIINYERIIKEYKKREHDFKLREETLLNLCDELEKKYDELRIKTNCHNLLSLT